MKLWSFFSKNFESNFDFGSYKLSSQCSLCFKVKLILLNNRMGKASGKCRH